MHEKVASQLKFEIDQIDRLSSTYADLVEKVRNSTPDLVEVTALASVLHSFYNGLENIFLSVAKGIDQEVPTGAQWHRDLLNQMAQATSHRGPVLALETTHHLANYLAFRHFYRHSYSFFLSWQEMEKLVIELAEVWSQTKQELEQFLGSPA